MKFYGQSEEAANRILTVFRTGKLPAALAPVFIQRAASGIPCRKWSWSNQLLTALAGHDDARGFRQWLDAGRAVRKGEKAFPILAPITVKTTTKDTDSGEERTGYRVVGFKSVPVFGLEQTDVVDADQWQRAAKGSQRVRQFLDGLPLLDVARQWGVSVAAFDGTPDGPFLGYYRHDGHIALGVENLKVWAHELTHAADHRNVGERFQGGQHLDQEVVAELGAAVLLTCIGLEPDADLGGVWRYIESYSTRAKLQPIAVCEKLLTRVCNAVALILDTADKLDGADAQGVAA